MKPDLSSENAQLKKDISALTDQISKLCERNSLGGRKKSFSFDVNLLDGEINSVKEDLARESELISQKIESMKMSWEQKVTELAVQNGDLKMELKEAETKIEAIKEEKEKLIDEKNILAVELSKGQEKFQEERESWNKEKSLLTEEIKILESKQCVEDIQREFEDFKATAKISERKNALLVKDLKKQLASSARKNDLNDLVGSSNSLIDGKLNSSTSFIQNIPTITGGHSRKASGNCSSNSIVNALNFMNVSTEDEFLRKISELQNEKWKLNQQIIMMEENLNLLKSDNQAKSKIIKDFLGDDKKKIDVEGLLISNKKKESRIEELLIKNQEFQQIIKQLSDDIEKYRRKK